MKLLVVFNITRIITYHGDKTLTNKNSYSSMLPDSLTSSSHLLIGCGSSIYRLINYSCNHFSTTLTESILASIGIAAIGARCLFNLLYNNIWRKYPIDPQSIEGDIKFQVNARYIIDSSLSVIGLASIIYSLYHHHRHQITGAIIISSLTFSEIICIHEEGLKLQNQTCSPNNLTTTNYLNDFALMINGYLKWLWIFFSGLIGWKVGNSYARLATVPYTILVLIYSSKSFYHDEWSTKSCFMDYMMLIYIILMTEAICTTFSD